MKPYYTRFFLIVSCLLVFSAAKAQTAPLEDVVEAFKNGKSATVAHYFDNVVSVTMNNTATTYSKTQAELVLKDFFSKNNPTGFTIANSGSPNKFSSYVIGDLSTSGDKYSIYLLLKLRDGTYYLQEIRINKE